jgi:hypothetical protein
MRQQTPHNAFSKEAHKQVKLGCYILNHSSGLQVSMVTSTREMPDDCLYTYYQGIMLLTPCLSFLPQALSAKYES